MRSPELPTWRRGIPHKIVGLHPLPTTTGSIGIRRRAHTVVGSPMPTRVPAGRPRRVRRLPPAAGVAGEVIAQRGCRPADIKLAAARGSCPTPRIGLVLYSGHIGRWRRAPRGMHDTAERVSRACEDGRWRRAPRGRRATTERVSLASEDWGGRPCERGPFDRSPRGRRARGVQCA